MKFSGLGRFALGQAVPDRDHAVCVSLPTFRDLIGYEEKDNRVQSSVRTGYPRFVQHHRIGETIRFLDLKEGTAGRRRFLFSNAQPCRQAVEIHSVAEARIEESEDFTSLLLPAESPDVDSIASFLQHSGSGISSRKAEDFLLKAGEINEREEISQHKNPEDKIATVIAKAHGPEISKEDVLLGSSGANVFYSLFQTACENSRAKGKDLWIRLGWLYLDTIEVMDLLTNENEQVIPLNRLEDFERIEELFKEHGEKIAGIVTEFPTNPLLQACNLEKIRDLCSKTDSLLIVDPTMVSPKNAKVSRLADVVVNSLTKYAGNEGDVMMGSLVFPRKSQLGRELFEQTAARICPPFERDLFRMAEQIERYENFIETTNRSLIKIVDFLERHEKIENVHWAYQSANKGTYEKVAGENRPGCVASFELKGSFESFYDRLEMLKSPSFGTQFSLCCPYVYLAHYKMIKSENGRKALAEAGLSHNLLRISVGTEDTDQITEVLKDALSAS